MAFKDVLKKQRQSGSGILSSVAGAAVDTAREASDIRNILFSKGSLLGALFPNIKGFKADAKITKPSSLVSEKSPTSVGLSDTKLEIINQNTKISAKNSMVLPSMARDMNVMRQNIVKMVKLSGGKASTGADMFFLKASEREQAYETQIQGAMTPTSPTRTESTSESKGAGKSARESLSSIFSGLLPALLPFIIKMTLVTGAVSLLYLTIKEFVDWFRNSWIGQKLGFDKPSPSSTNITGLQSDANQSDAETRRLTNAGNPTAPTAPTSEVSTFKTDAANVLAATTGTIAGVSAVSGGVKLASAAKATSTAVLDARTMSVGYLQNSDPKTKWGRFLKFVAQKSPQLWGKLGLKLAQASALATIPIVGWIVGAVQLGFSLWAAWEIYELWREFTKTEEPENNNSDSGSSERLMDPNLQRLPTAMPSASDMSGGATGRAPTAVSGSTSTAAGNTTTKGLLDIIAKGESGAAGYNAMNQGGNKKTGIIGSGNSEKIIGKKLTEMTIGEILQRGKLPMRNEDRVFAAGRYQIIPSTLKGLVDQGVAKESDRFDETTQDKLGSALIEQTGALRLAQQGDFAEAQNKLAAVWGAIPSATTGTTALGGPNKADPRLASLVQSTLRASGTQIASASSAIDASKMQAMTPPSTMSVSAPPATPKSRSTQGQQITIPNTIDSDLFDALVARATEFS